MHSSLVDIPDRIFRMGKSALAQANHHAIFHDPMSRDWGQLSIINTTLACELFIKGLIVIENLLLLFKNLFDFEFKNDSELTLNRIIEKGKSYDFGQLPNILWCTAGIKLKNIDVFNELRSIRNSIQHFCWTGSDAEARALSVRAIYLLIDPLISKYMGLYAIEYHEDFSIGYDYIVKYLLNNEILFNIPDDFQVSEFDIQEILAVRSNLYRVEMTRRLSKKGFKAGKISK